MHFSSFAEFVAMDGHGPYVWACYAIALTVILFNLISPILKRRHFFTVQGRILRRERQQKQQQQH